MKQTGHVELALAFGLNRCLCGLAIRHHFIRRGRNAGRKIDCHQAAARHQRAAIRKITLRALLREVGR